MNGNLPVAEVGTRPLRGTRACYRDRRDHRDHRDSAWEVLRARNRLAGFARANDQAQQHCLRTGQWLGAEALPSVEPMARRGSMACHFPAVSVVPVVSARPLETGIPCGRSSHWMVAFLAGGPPTSSGTPLRAARQLPAALPCGRPANFQRHSLAGGPATGWRHSLQGGPATGWRHSSRAVQPLDGGTPKKIQKPPCAWSANLLSFSRQQTGRALARSATTSCCLGDERKKE